MGLLGNGGCLLIKLGVTRLSQLAIDADKDWGDHGISNLKELASGMERGDSVQWGDSGVLERLAPGPIGFEITSNGPGHEVNWAAPPTP